MIGPAHVIGSAIRYGYEPMTRFPGEEVAVFVASEASQVTSFEQTKGKRLALPPADSLATYLARGELNARGVQASTHFKEIRQFRYHEATLLALDSFDVAKAGDKNAPMIFACNGAECWKSYKSCVAAIKAGYKQVYWFRGGFPEWVARGYPTDSVPANVALTR
jgi:rhodanese-related sulfurtransferase